MPRPRCRRWSSFGGWRCRPRSCSISRQGWEPTCRCAWPAGRPGLGIGEKLQPAPPLPACGLLLVNPGIALPTAAVFSARRGDFSQVQPLARPWSDLAGLVEALAARGNDLAAAAVALCPAIAEVLAFLRASPAVRYAAMSGSGATCFALYDTAAAAERAAAGAPPAWWRHAGTLES